MNRLSLVRNRQIRRRQCSASINDDFHRVIALSDSPTTAIRRATLTFIAGRIAIAYCTRCRQLVAWASRLGCLGKWGACSVFIDDDICLIVVGQAPGPGQNRRRLGKVQFFNSRRHGIVCVSLDWLLVLASFLNPDAVTRIPFRSSPPGSSVARCPITLSTPVRRPPVELIAEQSTFFFQG